MAQLDVRAFAVAVSAVWGFSVLLLGFSAMLTGYGREWVALLSTVYIGFAPDLLGVFFGVVWAVIDGAILGALIALVYNKASTKKWL
jgi:hypothetical protein